MWIPLRNLVSRGTDLHREDTVVAENLYTTFNQSTNAMKVLILVALFAIAAYASAGILPEVVYDGPIKDGADGEMINLQDVDTDAGLSARTESSPIRHRRVTCDILSLGTKWGSPSKIACPVRCLAQGRRGGSCKDGVCVCR